MKSDILIEPEPHITETENPPRLTKIPPVGRVSFNPALNMDSRIRTVIFDKLIAAADTLPAHIDLVVYEAYRPRARQIELWNTVMADIKQTYPNDDDDTLALRCNRFVANPYKHGSGHQYGCAVDVTLMDTRTGTELDMGCGLQEFCDKTETHSPLITQSQMNNRTILIDAMQSQGLVNYPPEWWHFSYGDRQWAIQNNLDETLFAALPF